MSVQAAAPIHFLTLDAFGAAGFRELLDLARRFKQDPASLRLPHPRGRIAMLFDKPSTRTRVSFEAAAWELGMLPIVLRPDELQLGRGETVADTARALSQYVDAIAIRTFAQASLEALAAVSWVPVVNALTDEHHPCQGLADALTIEECVGRFAGVTVAFVGDGDNVCHSLLQAAALAGFTLRIATPPGYEPSPDIVEQARAVGRDTGGEIVLLDDPRQAVRGADVVYADVWTSMGHESERAERLRTFAGYRVDAALMGEASPAAIFLHCLPAHRGEEVTDEVIDGPASRVWQQAANRLPTEAAILYAVLSGGVGRAGRA